MNKCIRRINTSLGSSINFQNKGYEFHQLILIYIQKVEIEKLDVNKLIIKD